MVARLMLIAAALLGVARPALAQTKEPELPPLLKRFPFAAKEEHVEVYSDISKEFSQAHARHGELVWKYFTRNFGLPPGEKTAIYYTRNEDLFHAVNRICGSPVLRNARLVAARHEPDGDFIRWFIVPFEIPDYGTQLHELSHSFLDRAYPGSMNSMWLREGTAMYIESAEQLTPRGELRIGRPAPHYVKSVKECFAKGTLVPLPKLLRMPVEEFAAGDFHQHYAQATLLMFYLMKAHPKAMQDILTRLKKGEIRDNDALLKALTTSIKLDERTLQMRYLEFTLLLGN